MRILLIYVMFIFSSFADEGSVGSGGTPPVLPTKDERTNSLNINNGKVQVINLASKFGNIINSNGISNNTVSSRRRLTAPVLANTQLDFSYTIVKDYKDLSIKLDQIEEVTLIDGTVLSKEEILESLNTKD